jgi:predicted GNAT family acetyltransferase
MRKNDQAATPLEVRQESSVQSFLAEAGPLLYREEAANSLILGICEGMTIIPSKNSPLLIRLVENGVTISAAVQTPPMNLVLTYSKLSQLEALAQFLFKSQARFPGVVGPAVEAENFAKIWSSKTNAKYRLGMGQKIYKLEEVIFPKTERGEFREASFDEVDTVFSWILAFAKESLPASDQRSEEHWKEFSLRAVQNQTAHFWMVNDRPVSVAFASRPTRNGISINGVYTPPAERKKGYASAVVAELSQKMLEAGKKFCVLYTDLANPTSNKIYREVGYREVCDSKHFIFDEEPTK